MLMHTNWLHIIPVINIVRFLADRFLWIRVATVGNRLTTIFIKAWKHL